MDFNEAEQRFRWLEDQRARGVITMEQYRSELNLLRLTDAHGRLWMLQERTGQWFVQDGGQWRAASPGNARQPAMASPPAPPAPPAQSAQVPEKGGGCGKALLYLLMWAVIWSVIGIGVFVIWGQDEPAGLLGVGLAALISLVFMLGSLSSAWSGTIEELRVKEERVTDDEGNSYVQHVRYAYVRQDNGKIKKTPAMPKWQVGDRLVKQRGEAHIRHYPART